MSKKKKITKEVNNMGSTNYPIGDFLIQIKNACLARNKKITVKESKFIKAVAVALQKDGYLSDAKTENSLVTVSLSYYMKEPVILGLKLVSRPGLRTYISVDELEKLRGPETLYLSTPEGVLSAKTAIKKRVGGEVIFKIW